jgi:hypothetical protein
MAVERIRTLVVPDHDELARVVARRIADLVREKTASGATAVLGARHRLHARSASTAS